MYVETSQIAWKHWMILFIVSNSVVLEELGHETVNRKCRRTANAVEIVWNRIWCCWWTDSSLHCHISAFENEAGSTANSYSSYLSTQGKDNSKEYMQIVTTTDLFIRLNGKVKYMQKNENPYQKHSVHWYSSALYVKQFQVWPFCISLYKKTSDARFCKSRLVWYYYQL